SLDQSSYLAALSQLSGETATGAAPTNVKAMDSFLGVMLNPFLDQRLSGQGGPALPFAADDDPSLGYAQKKKIAPAAQQAFASLRPATGSTRDERFNAWTSGYGSWGKTDGNAGTGSSAVDTRLGGIIGGVDYRPVPGLVLGAAVGGAWTSYSLDGGSGD